MMTRRQIDDVPFSARQMFDLVADVKRYPEFVPYCTGLRVLKEEKTDKQHVIFAEMLVQYKVFREKFKCRVTLDEKAFEIKVNYIEGPIKKLDNLWKFHEHDIKSDAKMDQPGGSQIEFEIEFEFKSLLMQAVSTRVFEKAFTYMSDAFVSRAHQLYGSNSS